MTTSKDELISYLDEQQERMAVDGYCPGELGVLTALRAALQDLTSVENICKCKAKNLAKASKEEIKRILLGDK